MNGVLESRQIEESGGYARVTDVYIMMKPLAANFGAGGLPVAVGQDVHHEDVYNEDGEIVTKIRMKSDDYLPYFDPDPLSLLQSLVYPMLTFQPL